MRPGVLIGIIGAVTLGTASRASGLPMDPALSRLVADAGCQAADATQLCRPDRAAYSKLVNQWGFALAPDPVHEARTTGLSELDVSVLAAFTGIDSSADYWRRGSQGDSTSARAGAVPLNADPDGVLQLYSLEVRKGFGFGIEAAGSVGVMPHASLVSFGADLRVALLEGMRHGALRYLPDTSLGIGLREVTGMGELSLGTLALDARVSHPLVGASGFVLTPWLGYQWVRIDADSALVDLTPDTDAISECGYLGQNVPGTPSGTLASGAPPGVFDGSPVCQNGSGRDFGNSVSFGQVDIRRQRLLLGVSYRQEFLKLGAEFLTDLLRPDAAQTDDTVGRALRCDVNGENCRPSPRQWTLVLRLGAAF